MLTIYSLQTNRPDDCQLQSIAEGFGGSIPLGMKIALCIRWLAIRQHHKTMAPSDRVNLTMAEHGRLAADARANLQKLDLPSVSSFGRIFNLMAVATAKCGPTLQDLPSILERAEIGALLIWSTEQNDHYPMAAHRSRGRKSDTLCLYTAYFGEFAPIKISKIQSLRTDAIRGFPEPIIGCKAVLMQLSEQVADTHEVVLRSSLAQASRPPRGDRHLRAAVDVEVIESYKYPYEAEFERQYDREVEIGRRLDNLNI